MMVFLWSPCTWCQSESVFIICLSDFWGFLFLISYMCLKQKDAIAQGQAITPLYYIQGDHKKTIIT